MQLQTGHQALAQGDMLTGLLLTRKSTNDERSDPMHCPVKRGAIALIVVCAVLSSAKAIAEKTAVVKPNRVEIAYVEPNNPAHRKIYEVLKQRRVLERFQAYLSPLRLPTTLTLKTDGCDGESNAWYEESDRTVTVCYEYIDDVVSNAPDMTTAAG
jgi:hypothetical protein